MGEIFTGMSTKGGNEPPQTETSDGESNAVDSNFSLAGSNEDISFRTDLRRGRMPGEVKRTNARRREGMKAR